MYSGLGYYVVNVPDAVRGKAFYEAVLGWRADSGADPEGYHHRTGSAPAGGIAGGAGTPGVVSYFLAEDAKATVANVRDLGGQAPDPVQSESGWSVQCADDQGTPFGLWQPSRDHTPDGPPKGEVGELFYWVLPVADDERAKRFYGELFGWELTPGSHARGWNIGGVEPPGGLFGAGTSGQIRVYFRVADIEAGVAKVRAAGGTSGPVEPNSAGWHADCVDDQGVKFSLGSLRDS